MIFGEHNPPKIVGIQYKDQREVEPRASTPSIRPEFDVDETKYKRKPADKLSPWYTLVILIYCLSIYGLVLVVDQRLPAPLALSDAPHHPEAFIEERARIWLKQLTRVGPRPAGSYENEVLTVDFLKREIKTIQERSIEPHRILVDVQKPRGSFNLKFFDGVTHHYRNIQNVIVKLESGGPAKDALLVNCHFDSVPESPGASDDAVSCAIMLEILNILSQSKQTLRHNIVFLFNGAEENLLPGSHGFITQHEWANEVRAFVNLEACGAGGRELVFQSGPNHPWMIEAYGKVAVHPFASVIGEEIFQSGIIPGDTDFRIFRDYGNIPGLDIAYMKNGYVYHTKYDTEDMIPPGSIQRAGDNILALVRHLANAEILSHTQDAKDGSVVFFDILGLFLVHYPEHLGYVINLIVVGLSLAATYRRINKSYQCGVSREVYIRQLGYSWVIQLAAAITAFVLVTMIATLLDAFNHSMSWYTRTYLIFFLYVCPTLFAVIAVFNFALPKQRKFFQFADGAWVIESLYFEVSRLIWTLYTLVMTLLRLKSSFLCMLWVLFPLIGRTLAESIYDRSAADKKQKDWKWVAILLISISFPMLLNMKLMHSAFVMFIPIMGRSGSVLNPDLIIGYKTVALTLGTLSFLCPLTMVVRRTSSILTTLYLTVIVTCLAVLFTPLGFPFSADKTFPTPHRDLIIHTSREFYDQSGQMINTDAGYFVFNLDRHSPKVLLKHVPEYHSLREIGDAECEKHLFCGMPIYYPCTTMLKINHWLPTRAPKMEHKATVQLVTSEVSGTPHQYKLLFRVSGPDHMGIYFSPEENVQLIRWSFDEDQILTGPTWKDNRPTHYIFYSHGLSMSTWEFWLELKVPRTFVAGVSPFLDLAVTGHYLHGHSMKDVNFKRFLSQFPDWSFPVGWTASYAAYKF